LKINVPGRSWGFAFVLAFMICGAVAAADQRAKVPRIGRLTVGTAAGDISAGLTRALREIGYVEGKNIVVENRYADNQLDRIPAQVEELIHLKVDVLVVIGPPAALAAKKATQTIPIVVYGVADPVALGLVNSLASPGGNITGFTIVTEELAAKRLALLKETVPKLSRIALFWNPKNAGNALQMKQSLQAARNLGLQLHPIEVSSAEKIETAFKVAASANSAALAMTQDPVFGSNAQQIADLAIKNRWPTMYSRGEFVDSGGLMSYGADQAEQDKRAAYHIDKILKGAKPAALPFEPPTKFELTINLKTAKALGLTIPPEIMVRATRVIE
jgi:putative ABC transport system substrate-binding protein